MSLNELGVVGDVGVLGALGDVGVLGAFRLHRCPWCHR